MLAPVPTYDPYWDNHPYQYQLRHLWHWATYGQNGITLAAIIASVVGLFSLAVLYRTLRAVNRQAIAADRQAEAAEAQATAAREQTVAANRAAAAAEGQVLAARGASAVSEAQLSAARDAADAARKHSELIREQMQATLRPVLVFLWDVNIQRQPILALQNQSATAVASSIFIEGLKPNLSLTMRAASTMLGPGAKTTVAGFDVTRWHATELQVTYDSDDGRRFVTIATIDKESDIRQRAEYVGQMQKTAPPQAR